MPIFKFHFRHRNLVTPDDMGVEFGTLEEAYLDVCRSIPAIARELLTEGRDPMACGFTICDESGQRLMDVPFTEVLSPGEWRLRRARRRPHGGSRSKRARDNLALTSFRRIFGSANVGGVLLTPELQVVEITEYGARHSHVDPEAIRGVSILDVFVDLKGEPKANFTQFMKLAQAGAVSEVVDLPYYVLDDAGQTAVGWWNARTWPIFDADHHLLGLVEWATPHTRPTLSGETIVRVTRGHTA